MFKLLQGALGEVAAECRLIARRIISVVAAYALGWWLAPYIGADMAGRDTVGILFVLGTIWHEQDRHIDQRLNSTRRSTH